MRVAIRARPASPLAEEIPGWKTFSPPSASSAVKAVRRGIAVNQPPAVLRALRVSVVKAVTFAVEGQREGGRKGVARLAVRDTQTGRTGVPGMLVASRAARRYT